MKEHLRLRQEQLPPPTVLRRAAEAYEQLAGHLEAGDCTAAEAMATAQQIKRETLAAFRDAVSGRAAS